MQLVSQVGFPIAVAVYSLVTLNKTMSRVAIVLERICTKLGVETDADK